ncbi:endonuclease/exonuclease/phosphatase family protein [Sphingosinicella microcystinivorans]|uniref:Endonuclease n=1 Tax=Sphingosinicella microcystinivorans TaxID=335406 RepID=A0AAD1G139_SPHMI|nr:endonuclease/exonuclease/phosphatase family protein [Sphingosinicella microcystinivorans]RKS91562.1 endonuclease/exonuclease/phosphatase family metal-dependent hydrolase [Sphingosinicella microcystinivorans]BBE34542.1 endonuclease [Sphingosinicella microcystinivorans]
MTLRVASYNMRKAIGLDRLRKPDRVLAVLNELDADIIALQEADRRLGERASAIPRAMIEAESPYRAVPIENRPNSIGWHGNAILVRKDHEIIHGEPLFLPMLEPRGAVLADLVVRGESVRVVGMHLDLSGLYRARQAKMLVDHLGERTTQLPSILMGDLNDWMVNSKALKEFQRHHQCAACGPSFPTRRPLGTLDRIFVSDHFKVEESGVHTSLTAKRASDHLPVWANIARST